MKDNECKKKFANEMDAKYYERMEIRIECEECEKEFVKERNVESHRRMKSMAPLSKKRPGRKPPDLEDNIVFNSPSIPRKKVIKQETENKAKIIKTEKVNFETKPSRKTVVKQEIENKVKIIETKMENLKQKQKKS